MLMNKIYMIALRRWDIIGNSWYIHNKVISYYIAALLATLRFRKDAAFMFWKPVYIAVCAYGKSVFHMIIESLSQ